MLALVDCNNFYCSAERLFAPHLIGKPIVVLSNNDGCVIARSDEAKELGVVMGSPAFMIQETLAAHNVQIFSSNYTLYGDISDRVMQTLATFATRIEVYSIDECFVDLADMPYNDLLKLGMRIKNTVFQNVGIPVCVGIAPTKALAKLANKYAKKHGKRLGVHYVANDHLRLEMLASTSIEDVWGIGHQYAKMLQVKGVKTALDFVQLPEEFIRSEMTVVGQRLYNELRGINAIESIYVKRIKKGICTSRSFGTLLTEKKEIRIAVADYAARCAKKLRSQQTNCKLVNVFIHTNPHKTEEQQYRMGINLQLETATNDAGILIKSACKGFDMIYRAGYRYMKCGVQVMDLTPENVVQQNLFANDNPKKKELMLAMDKINNLMGVECVKTASQGWDLRYKMKSEHLSKQYTTNLNELKTIYLK